MFDCWYHDQDIREALDRPGFLEGAVADLSLGRIPAKALRYVVGKKAGAPPGTTVVFDIAGEPPIVAAIGVDGRAALCRDDAGGTDGRLTLDRRTFARLAGGRWTGETPAPRVTYGSRATTRSGSASSTTSRSRSDSG